MTDKPCVTCEQEKNGFQGHRLAVSGLCPSIYAADLRRHYEAIRDDPKHGGHNLALDALRELRRSCAYAVKHETHPDAQRRLQIVARQHEIAAVYAP